MSEPMQPTPSEDLQRIIESAQRLGVELDEEEAIQWLTAVTAAMNEEVDIAFDARSGVFGHRVTMLDFSAEELAHFRKVGELVEFEDQPGVVETALALSGSAAQSKIQSYPGDTDYFERVNILTDTREQACKVLADLLRNKALDTMTGPTFQLIEVKFGNFPQDMLHGGRLMKAGTPISWTAAEVQDGRISGTNLEGAPISVTWEEASRDPGWCKLDWVVVDAAHKQLANASNMLDVTWEAPDGTITPLDGYLDPYFQEVYLEAESIPVFSKLAKHVSSDALDEYVTQLEKEVRKYLTKEINYGKAAKRMYNVFRLTGRYQEAAFLRELFDEPATMLYQVRSLVRTIDDAMGEDRSIALEALLTQADSLILAVIGVLDGAQETELVRLLLRLKDTLARDRDSEDWAVQVETVRAELINIINNFYFERMTALPTIQDYMADITS